MHAPRKTVLGLFALALSARSSCADGLADKVFAAIDDQNEGLKTVNKEVSLP